MYIRNKKYPTTQKRKLLIPNIQLGFRKDYVYGLCYCNITDFWVMRHGLDFWLRWGPNQNIVYIQI